MREQILRLDPHDDYHSARDKMGWTQTQRVIVVWPDRGLNRRLDLLLLLRHAARLGAQMAIVTTLPDIRAFAAELGLPVFSSIDASRRARWRSRPRLSRPHRPAARTTLADLKPPPPFYTRWNVPLWVQWVWKTLVLTLGLAALVLLGQAVIPSASITLAPAALPIQTTVTVIADPALTTPSGNTVPARAVYAEVETSGHLTTTGVKDVPSDQATGLVVFTNLAGSAVTIPKGLSLRTTSGQAIRFVTVQPASLTARFGSTAEVAIRAVEPGPAGNVGVGQVNAIDGPLGLQLAVTNPNPTAGGTVASRYAVSLADRAQLRAQLLSQLDPVARDTLDSQLPPGDFLAVDTVSLEHVVAESYSHAVGDVTDILTLTLRISVTGLRISEAEVRTVAQAALTAATPSSESLLPGQTRFERDPLTHLDTQGRILVAINAIGTAIPVIDTTRLREWAAGQPIPVIHQALTNMLTLAAPPQITVTPGWFAEWYNRLPWLPYQIHVVVQPSP